MQLSLLRFSRWAALVAGIVVPLTETARRFGTGNYLLWIDDYLIGAALLLAFWQTRSDLDGRRVWLASGWAFTIGVGYMALIGHWLSINQPDVSGIDQRVVTGVLAAGLLVAVVALWASLRSSSPD